MNEENATGLQFAWFQYCTAWCHCYLLLKFLKRFVLYISLLTFGMIILNYSEVSVAHTRQTTVRNGICALIKCNRSIVSLYQVDLCAWASLNVVTRCTGCLKILALPGWFWQADLHTMYITQCSLFVVLTSLENSC